MQIYRRPIGVFDSGLGGLTVVKEIVKILPHEDIIYLGDTARVPYGTRGVDTIQHFSEGNTRFLLKKGVKAVVIACNTSSAVAADFLKSKFKNTPIFEVIDSASREAAENGRIIGVIGTRATIGSLAYAKKVAKYSPKSKVIGVPCPLFVPFIEEGEVSSRSLRIIAKKYLTPLKIRNIDTLILGCTHYPIIKNVIAGIMGPQVTLINPGKSIAKEVSNYLRDKSLLNSQKAKGDIRYFVTDMTDRFTKMAEMFLGRKIRHKLQKVEV